MNEDLIQLPDVKELTEMLTMTKQDVTSEIEEDPELASMSQLLLKVISILEEKIGNHKDLNALKEKEKIDIAAHINFLQTLQDDYFFDDEDLEFEDDDQWEDEEEPPLNEKH